MKTTPAPDRTAAVPDEARTARVQRRVAQRLRGRSRAVWVVAALLIATAVAVVLAVEAVVFALGRPPLLVAPDVVRRALTEGGSTGAIVAAVAAVFGILCLWGALAPGRTHRRALAAGRVPLVVDDAVLAGALSRTAGTAAALSPSHVSTQLGDRRARIALTPSTGFAVDRARVAQATDGLLVEVGAAPRLTARIDVATEGRLS